MLLEGNTQTHPKTIICQDRRHAKFLSMGESEIFFKLVYFEGRQKGNQFPQHDEIDILILVLMPPLKQVLVCKNREENVKATSFMTLIFFHEKNAKSSFFYFSTLIRYNFGCS